MRWFAAAAVGLVFVAGCENASTENIARWKSTEKGPAKLEAALKDGKVPAPLRAEAALALLDLGHPEPVDAAWTTMPPAERTEVVAALVPLATAVLAQGSINKARDARDALFTVRSFAAPADGQRIDAELLASVTRDLRMARISGGRYSADTILRALGPAVTPMLVQLLEDPTTSYQAIAEVFLKVVSDPAGRERGGKALVKRASKGEIPPQLWRALGAVGGLSANEFLKGKVERGRDIEALSAAQALQNGPKDPLLVPFALRLAGDAHANKGVRDEMFGLLEHVGGPAARDGLVRIIASDKEDLVRYRAYETALAVGGPDAVVPALEAFPAGASYAREDVVDFLVKDLQKLGGPATSALKKALFSKSPLGRMTGVLGLEQLGGPGDAPALEAIGRDRTTLKGFSGGTVGAEAARVAVALRTKKGSGRKP